jgi:hypothetical protein
MTDGHAVSIARRAAVREASIPRRLRSYAEMGRHYGTAIVPARPYKARDKAKVEVGVQIAQRWILARLRNQTFFSLAELNRRIAELLEDMNRRPMKKLGGVTRRELYERYDGAALRALPADRFEIAEWDEATVNMDYHIEYEKHWYSVPYEHARESVWVRATVLPRHLPGTRSRRLCDGRHGGGAGGFGCVMGIMQRALG